VASAGRFFPPPSNRSSPDASHRLASWQELTGDDVFEALRLPATSAIRAKLKAKGGGGKGSLLQQLVSEVKNMASASGGSVDSNTQVKRPTNQSTLAVEGSTHQLS